MEFAALTEAQIETWHSVRPPNDAARRLGADTAAVIAAFEAVRDRMRFEDEPSSFEDALRAVKEHGA